MSSGPSIPRSKRKTRTIEITLSDRALERVESFARTFRCSRSVAVEAAVMECRYLSESEVDAAIHRRG